MALETVIRQVNPSCHDSEDGFISVLVGGGSPPYDISWEDADGTEISTGSSARGLEAGEYRVIYNDSAGLTGNDTITLENPAYQETIPEIGMTLCQLNCFLKLSSCQAGNLGYKYFVQQPNDGIECKKNQKETIWLLNAIDTLSCWKPEDTVVENGIVAQFTIVSPTMTCGILGATFTVDAYLVSSVDGTVAYYHSDTNVNVQYPRLIVQSFYTTLNALSNYSATLDPTNPFTTAFLEVTAEGTQYNDSTLTLYIVITNLDDCTIDGGQGWTITADGGTYYDTPSTEENTYTTTEPCLTNEQAGVMVENIKQLIAGCNVKNLAKDLALT